MWNEDIRYPVIYYVLWYLCSGMAHELILQQRLMRVVLYSSTFEDVYPVNVALIARDGTEVLDSSPRLLAFPEGVYYFDYIGKSPRIFVFMPKLIAKFKSFSHPHRGWLICIYYKFCGNGAG